MLSIVISDYLCVKTQECPLAFGKVVHSLLGFKASTYYFNVKINNNLDIIFLHRPSFQDNGRSLKIYFFEKLGK